MLGQTVFSLDFFMLIGKDTQSRPPTLRRRQSNLTRILQEFQALFDLLRSLGRVS